MKSNYDFSPEQIDDAKRALFNMEYNNGISRYKRTYPSQDERCHRYASNDAQKKVDEIFGTTVQYQPSEKTTHLTADPEQELLMSSHGHDDNKESNQGANESLPPQHFGKATSSGAITVKELKEVLTKYAVKNTLTKWGNRLAFRTMGPQGKHQSEEYRELLALTKNLKGEDRADSDLISSSKIEFALSGESRATLFKEAREEYRQNRSNTLKHHEKDTLDTNEIAEQLGQLVASKGPK